MPNPILTLTTDFGLSDHYVGTMKGVILSICGDAHLIDISHELTPFEIPEAAYTIAQAYRYFPKRTVHIVVVDPGVGTSRRGLLVEAGGHYFVGPDNGVFTMLYSREPLHKVRAITSECLYLKPTSNTFHGRDIFAPVAARIAAGMTPVHVGEFVKDYLRLNFEKPVQTGKRTWTGQILKIDRFGNLITNLHRDTFPDLEKKNCSLTVGPHTVTVMATNYSQTSPGELFLLFGSGGYLEVACAQASAAKAIGCAVGAPVELARW